MAYPEGDLTAVLEPLAYSAWPAAEVQELEGWRLRANHGVTNRASSVWPARPPEEPDSLALQERIDLAEAFYAHRGQPARFQLTPLAWPAGLDAALAARGYERYSPVQVQVAEVATLLEGLRETPAAECQEGLSEAWFELSGRRGRYRGDAVAVYRSLLQRIPEPKGFAVARLAGEPAAVGLGVARGAFAGVFSMLTLPAHRSRGLGHSVLAGLAEWAQGTGATRLYLQVEEANSRAGSLYAAAGFAPAYRYHYRRKVLAR